MIHSIPSRQRSRKGARSNRVFSWQELGAQSTGFQPYDWRTRIDGRPGGAGDEKLGAVPQTAEPGSDDRSRDRRHQSDPQGSARRPGKPRNGKCCVSNAPSGWRTNANGNGNNNRKRELEAEKQRKLELEAQRKRKAQEKLQKAADGTRAQAGTGAAAATG